MVIGVVMWSEMSIDMLIRRRVRGEVMLRETVWERSRAECCTIRDEGGTGWE